MIDLEEVKARSAAAERAWRLLPTPPSVALSAANVPRLVAEVELLREVARELADALADNGHDFGDDEGCLGCAALNTYGDVFGVPTAGEVDG